MPKTPLVLIVLAFVLFECCTTTRTQLGEGTAPASSYNRYKRRPDLKGLHERFQNFHRTDTGASYVIKLCADVPYDKNPARVAYRNRPGHVFLVFSQYSQHHDTVNQAFGYYPIQEASVVIFKTIRSKIQDNGGREYNAHIACAVQADKFFSLLDSALHLAKKKYNLNRFNCYDYGIHLFNMAVGAGTPLTLRYVKFPFIWGRGGSPTGLYAQLQVIKQTDSAWADRITFGQLKAPQ
jgi:hypothetical protein